MDSVKVAVVGGGYWGKNLIRNFAELGVLYAICDVDYEKIRAYERFYPGVRLFMAYLEALQDPEVKAVVIATPPESHFRLVRGALLSGKDTFVEKPLALNLSEAEELVALAEEKGRVLMVGHLLHYHPAFIRLRELVRTGELGRVNYIYSNRLNIGKIRRDENVLWSFAPHDISLILDLVGEFPEEVAAFGGNYLHQRIADVTLSILHFPSGIKAHIFVSWLHPYKEQRLVVVGEQQMAVFNDVASWSEKILLYPHRIEWKEGIPIPDEREAVRVEVEEKEPLKEECRHFLTCIVERKSPKTNGHEALKVLRVLNALQRSLESGGEVIKHLEAREGKPYFVHESAYIDEGVEIGEGTRIWHFSHVMSGAKIGRECTIGQNVFIGRNVRIGNNVKIQNHVSVFEGVEIEDDVFCGPSMTFTNVFNPRSFISRMGELRRTLVKRGATIGAHATIVCGKTIGRYAFVGAGSVVTRDVPDHALFYGNPGRIRGWVCKCGVKLELEGELAHCPACGLSFKMGEKEVEPLPEEQKAGPYGAHPKG